MEMSSSWRQWTRQWPIGAITTIWPLECRCRVGRHWPYACGVGHRHSDCEPLSSTLCDCVFLWLFGRLRSEGREWGLVRSTCDEKRTKIEKSIIRRSVWMECLFQCLFSFHCSLQSRIYVHIYAEMEIKDRLVDSFKLKSKYLWKLRQTLEILDPFRGSKRVEE